MVFDKNCFINDKEDSVKSKSMLFEVIDIIISVILIFTVMQIFILKMVTVEGESMLPNLKNNDRVMLNNFLYEPKTGDIVVIAPTQSVDSTIIKRVIATEGHSIKISFDTGDVYVDKNLLDEPYINTPTNTGDADIPEVVPEGYVFVMGDNRNHSTDSRFKQVGLVDKKDIIGKAQFIVFPFNRLGNLYKV